MISKFFFLHSTIKSVTHIDPDIYTSASTCSYASLARAAAPMCASCTSSRSSLSAIVIGFATVFWVLWRMLCRYRSPC